MEKNIRFLQKCPKITNKIGAKKKWDTDQILTKLKIDSVHFAENL